MKTIYTFAMMFACAAMLCGNAQAQQPMSFDDALQTAYANSHGLKQSDAAVREKERLAAARKALYLPTLSLSANAVRLPEDLTLDLTPVKNSITPLYQSLGAYGNFSGVQTPNGTLSDEASTKVTLKFAEVKK